MILRSCSRQFPLPTPFGDWVTMKLLEEIGRGGMGVIYRARQRYSRRIVALKRVLTYHAESHERWPAFGVKPKPLPALIIPTFCRSTKSVETEKGFPISA